MRTTINIDDDLLERLRSEARRSRSSLGQTLNRALRLGVERLHPGKKRAPFQSPTFDMGFPPLAHMNKALQLSSALEDEETISKLQLGK